MGENTGNVKLTWDSESCGEVPGGIQGEITPTFTESEIVLFQAFFVLILLHFFLLSHPEFSKCYNQFLGFIILIFHYLFCLIYFLNSNMDSHVILYSVSSKTAILFNTICLRICFIVGML